jgi:hypothetical protein
MQFASPEKEREITKYFVNYKYSWNTASTKGRYDIIETILVKDLKSFYSFYEKTLGKYRYYFKDISFSQLWETYGCQRSLLLDKNNTSCKKEYGFRNTGVVSKLDDID